MWSRPSLVPGAAVGVLGAGLLAGSIALLTGEIAHSAVARLAVVPEQAIRVDRPGRIELRLDHRRTDPALLGARYRLEDAAGTEVAATVLAQHPLDAGFARQVVGLRAFDIAVPGDYTLKVDAPDATGDVSQDRLVVVRPFGVRAVWLLLGIALGATGLVGGGGMCLVRWRLRAVR